MLPKKTVIYLLIFHCFLYVKLYVIFYKNVFLLIFLGGTD